MARKSIPQGIIKALHSQVDKLYNKAKKRFLGTGSGSDFTEDLSLPGIFRSAAREEYNKPDSILLNSVLKIAEGYIDSQKENVKAQLVSAIDAAIQTASHGEFDFQSLLQDKLKDIWEKATANISKIVQTETNGAKNLATLDGITKVSAAYGIEDPLIATLAPLDLKTCDVCLRLHFTEDGKSPRVYKLSEMKHGHQQKDDETASTSGGHPNCRMTLQLIMPGYGYDGMQLKYIGPGHDELDRQRNL